MIFLNPLTISIKFKFKLNHINFDYTKVYNYNILFLNIIYNSF